MLNFFKSIAFLVSFQFSLIQKFFFTRSKKTGLRFYQDFGVIEAALVTKTQLREMRTYMQAMEADLQKQQAAGKDPTSPQFNLGGNISKLLS